MNFLSNVLRSNWKSTQYNTIQYNTSWGTETPPGTSLQAYFVAHGRSNKQTNKQPFGVAVLTVGVMHCYIATVPLSQKKLLHSCFTPAIEMLLTPRRQQTLDPRQRV